MLRVFYKSPMHFTSLLSSIILPICNYIVRFFLDILIGFLYTKVAKNAIKVRRGGNIFPRFFFQIYCSMYEVFLCFQQSVRYKIFCVHLTKKNLYSSTLFFSSRSFVKPDLTFFAAEAKLFRTSSCRSIK